MLQFLLLITFIDRFILLNSISAYEIYQIKKLSVAFTYLIYKFLNSQARILAKVKSVLHFSICENSSHKETNFPFTVFAIVLLPTYIICDISEEQLV